MTIDDDKLTAEIEQAFKDDEEAYKPPYTAWQRLTDCYYQFDSRLNNAGWLNDRIMNQQQSEAGIAHLIGCSERLVHKKLVQTGLLETGHFQFGVNTGNFHFIKRFLRPFLKPYILKIQTGIDTVYDKTKSRNSQVFKDIILELEALDDDTGYSMADEFGLSRKEFNLLAAKFLVCLYEFDNHYSERMDYVIRRLQESEIYLDEQSQPANWYPHRDLKTVTKYMVNRNIKI